MAAVDEDQYNDMPLFSQPVTEDEEEFGLEIA